MSEERLKKLLEAGDEQQGVAFFKDLTEKQRRALAPMCLAWFRKINSNDFIETKPGTFTRNSLLPMAALAAFGTASFSELKKLGWQARPDGDLAYQMMLDRRPEWLSDWAAELLVEDYYWNHWSIIRRLIAAGLIEKPEHPNYIPAMISGIAGPGGRTRNDLTVEQALREDPSLWDDEIWRLFEIEGEGQNSLANWDRFSHGGKWLDALVALVTSGDLPRERLLSCCLDALELDFNHYRAKWFSSLHDALKPTAEEQREFAQRYLRLLGVSAPNIVSWALKKIESLSKGDALEASVLIAGLRPVMEARQKGIVKKSLKLLAKTAKQSPAAADDAAETALSGLAHEEGDVQAAVLDVVEACGDLENPEFLARLAEYAGVVVPSERRRMARWLGPAAGQPGALPDAPELEPAAPVDEKLLEGIDAQLLELYGVNAILDNLSNGRGEIPAATFDGTDIPRLDPAQRISPIEAIDELIEVWSRVIEDDSLVDDVERVIDGVSRLCDQKPDDFQQRIGPLLTRATQRLKKDMAPFIGIGADDDLCGLVYAWCTGIVLEGTETERHRHRVVRFEIEGEEHGTFSENLEKVIGFLSRRVLAVAQRVSAGNAVQLLSTPTHVGGWIDPIELVQRVNALGDAEADVMDVCLAMLRLAPEHRSEARRQLNACSTEWGRAVHYALGAEDVQIGETAALWIAAARCRSPWSDDENVAKAFPTHGPDAGRAASYTLAFSTDEHNNTSLAITPNPPRPKTTDRNCVTVTMHTQLNAVQGLRWELGGIGGKTIGSIRWTATVWPQARDSFFAGAACDLANNLDWWEAQWRNKALLEPLLDSGTPLREMGLLLLAAGLAAKDPGEYGLATDVAICAIEDGRLGADNLGPMLARLLPTGLIKPGRWQKRFVDIARISPVHAAVFQQALQRCFTGAGTMPRDFAKLLELLKELSIDLGQSISHEPCREFLAAMKGTGKAAKTAKALLALEASDPSRYRGVLRQALDQRLQVVRAIAEATMNQPGD